MKKFFDRITIRQILVAGFIIRLLAVIFSRGYGFHDDHFEVIDLAQKWREGIPFSWSGSNIHMFSLLYPGIHYLLLSGCEAIGIHDPNDIMLVVRLFHALVSLGGIYFMYLLALRLTNNKATANIAALAMALFWIFPFLSVRSLREFFCIPFLLAGAFYAVKIIDSDDPTRPVGSKHLAVSSILYAAFFFAIAFCIRLQTVFIPMGIGLYLLFKKHYLKQALVFGISFIVFLFLTQGLFDWLHYGNPLASSLEYLRYNSDTANIKGYPQGPWYQYLGTLALITLGIPVIPLLLGYIRSFRISPSLLMLGLSTLLFFAFHSFYSNKQERFILPFVPFFLLLGFIGAKDYYEKHRDTLWVRRSLRLLLGWFLFFNTIGLLVLSFTYSKRARVESMNYLRKKGDVSNMIMEGMSTPPPPPQYYLGAYFHYYELPAGKPMDSLRAEINNGLYPPPNYIIMAGNTNLEARLVRLHTLFPSMKHETDIKPGFIDNFSYWLNPGHNQNETWYIYRVE